MNTMIELYPEETQERRIRGSLALNKQTRLGRLIRTYDRPISSKEDASLLPECFFLDSTHSTYRCTIPNSASQASVEISGTIAVWVRRHLPYVYQLLARKAHAAIESSGRVH